MHYACSWAQNCPAAPVDPEPPGKETQDKATEWSEDKERKWIKKRQDKSKHQTSFQSLERAQRKAALVRSYNISLTYCVMILVASGGVFAYHFSFITNYWQ